jgi:hypothetical protein
VVDARVARAEQVRQQRGELLIGDTCTLHSEHNREGDLEKRLDCLLRSRGSLGKAGRRVDRLLDRRDQPRHPAAEVAKQ